MSSITLNRVVEAMEFGLKNLEAHLWECNRQIKILEKKRDQVWQQASTQRTAVIALVALRDEEAKNGTQITLTFPS